jgi:hypothetical protein
VLAENADRRVDLACHDRDAAPHVARIYLNEVRAHVAGGGEAGAVVENAAIARMSDVPGQLAWALR